MQMLLQILMMYGINGNAFKVNPLILFYRCLQHIKFQDEVTKIFNKSQKCNIYPT